MIERLHIENFKAIRELSLEFGKVAVFVGPNSSGKTSVLEAVRLSFLAGYSDPDQVFRGRLSHENLVSSGAKDENVSLVWMGREDESVELSVNLFSRKNAAVNNWSIRNYEHVFV